MMRWVWCQYGCPDELPNIYHRKEYEAGLDKATDYRLTCFLHRQGPPAQGRAVVAFVVPWT